MIQSYNKALTIAIIQIKILNLINRNRFTKQKNKKFITSKKH